MLTPAMNLFTVGTKRDSQKWPNRDRRKDPDKLDLIHFDILSPYVVDKIIQARELLLDLSEKASDQQKMVTINGINIKRLLLKTCRKYYQIALKKYFGDQILNRLANRSFQGIEEIRSALQVNQPSQGKWLDIAGMFAPKQLIDQLIEDLKGRNIGSIEQLHNRLRSIFDNYDDLAWGWCCHIMSSQNGVELDQITDQQLLQVIEDWQINSKKLNNMILKDAEKEFDPNSRIGFGLDGDSDTQVSDFVAVRGNYQDNAFILGLKKENEEIDETAKYWVDQLSALVK